ncbi:MAG: PilZ domain-containing protein [Deltaproteobacteria bacterium]|nr:PilZ domain-containing protein [Deltaproteobacteria bacterium]
MDNSEIISGKKIFDILDQLKNNHTILNIHVVGSDFDGLSIILGVSDGENPRFFIDYPGRAILDTDFIAGKKCYFEFSDEEKIKYSFKATVDSIFGKRIKFTFPEYIERTQRRKAFRIPAPSGSRLIYPDKDGQIELDIINISEYGFLVSLKGNIYSESIFFKGSKLKNLFLSAGRESKSIRINIGSVEVIRIEKINESRSIRFGLKIIEIENREQDELRRFIYYCQRKELKKRGRFDY